jgi:hypothetical protein
VVEQAGEREAVIAKGISAGELVVTEGQLKLRPDAPVEILEGGGEPAGAAGGEPEKAAAR